MKNAVSANAAETSEKSRPAARGEGVSSPALSKSKPKGGRPLLSSIQIVFGSILAISLLLAINFSGRIAAGRNITRERAGLDRQIKTLEAQATALHAELGYVSSDAYVEAWARQRGNMVKANERLIIPVPPKQTAVPFATPTPPAFELTREPDVSNVDLWWGLFFDSPAPGN